MRNSGFAKSVFLNLDLFEMDRAIKISDLSIEIKRSKRRTLAMEFRPDGTLLIRAPFRTPNTKIRQFLTENEDWVLRHYEKVLARREKNAEITPFSRAELEELATQALNVLPKKAAYYAKIIGVDYGRITIRNQKTRWGSCSSKGNLNFNCLLMLLPEDVQDYVVVHELCHRKEMNHSKAFWREVEKVLPNYRALRKTLRREGEAVMARNRA